MVLSQFVSQKQKILLQRVPNSRPIKISEAADSKFDSKLFKDRVLSFPGQETVIPSVGAYVPCTCTWSIKQTVKVAIFKKII